MSQFSKDISKIDRQKIREVVSTLAKITSRSPEEIKPYLDELLFRLFEEPFPNDKHFFYTSSDKEWIASFNEWSQSHKLRNLPVLSNEAMSRDSIYDERSEWDIS